VADTTNLDKFRGMAAQRATESRRRVRAVVSEQEVARLRRDEFEAFLFREPAGTWSDAAARARYLMVLMAADAADPRLSRMVGSVLSDFERLLAARRR